MPGVRMGGGVIIRTGDRASTFDPEATRFLDEVASGLALKNKKFRHQRALMSGGTCEATAYQEFGYQTAAVCVALGNYHNCGPRNRIEEEYVSVQDMQSMVDLLLETAIRMPDYHDLTGKLGERLSGLLQQARQHLPESA